MTVVRLAALSDLKPTTLYDLERGRSHSTTKLHKIAAALRVSVIFLETGRGNPESSAAPTVKADDWPFTVERARFDRLAEREKEAIDSMLTTYISHCEVSGQKPGTKRRTG